MKLQKLFYPAVLIASLVLLSACQAEEQVPPNGNGSTTQTQSTSQKAEVHSLADQTAYQGAQQLKDPTFCAKIENENYKKQCENEIADQVTAEAAVTKVQAGDCKKIQNADKEKACELQVEIKMKQQQQSQELQANYDKFNKLSNEGDYEKCKTLQDSNLVTACEENILTNKALNTKEKSWCQKISDSKAQQRCFDAVKNFENK